MKYIYYGLMVVGFAVLLNAVTFVMVKPTDEKKDEFETYSYEITMRQADAENILSIIDTEGFDNTFTHFTTFRDIGDHRFHELRKAYVAAAQELKDYLADASKMHDEVPYYLRNYTHENRN